MGPESKYDTVDVQQGENSWVRYEPMQWGFVGDDTVERLADAQGVPPYQIREQLAEKGLWSLVQYGKCRACDAWHVVVKADYLIGAELDGHGHLGVLARHHSEWVSRTDMKAIGIST